jgi:PAS domain S-box-containing protein
MLSLLYVDDEPGLLEIGKIYLENTGDFSVTTALSGIEALDELGKHDFDAVVADYQMPEMDGIELLKNVRKFHGNIPYILFTGRGREEVVIEAINNGVDFYLQKGGDPQVQFAELAHKVWQAVSRRQAEMALSDSEKRLADIINFLPDATFAIDLEGRVIAWNRAMEMMTGIRSKEILGKGDYEYALPFYRERRPLLINLILSDNPAIAARYPQVKREGTTLFSEITTRHFRGNKKATLWFTASPLYNRKGEVTGAIESIRDITERMRAEEALHVQEQLLKDTFSSIRDGISILDTSMTVVRVNQTMEEWYSHELPLVGRKCWEVYHGRTERCEVCPSYTTLQTGKPSRETVPMVDAGKQVGWLDLYSFPLIDSATGEMTGVIEYVRNITAEKQAQDELKAAYEQLTASEEELRQQYGELSGTQENLMRQQQQLEEIASTIPGVVYQFYARPDGSMGLYYVSSRAADIFGISSNSEDFFERFTEHVDFRDRQAFLQSNVDVARNGLPWHYEGRFIKPSGEEIWFEGISRPVRRGTELVFNGVLLDITERKRAEEDLFSSRQMLQAVLDSIPQRVFWKDRNSVFLGCNKPLALDAGFSEPADMVGKTDYDHASHETADLYRADDRKVMETGQPRINYEEPQIRPDGSHAWLRTTKVPLRNKEGTIIGVLGTYEDITERKQAVEALRESEKKFRQLITSAPLPLSFANSKGEIEFINAKFTQLFGYTHAEIPTLKEWFDHAYPDKEYQKQVLDAWDAAVKNASENNTDIEPAEYNVTCRNGSIRNVIISGITIEGKLLATFIDNTEQRKAEEALRESEEKYRTLVKRSQDGIVVVQDERIAFVNGALMEMIGYSEEELLGHSVEEFIAPEDAGIVIARHRERMSGRDVVSSYEYSLLHKDGNTRVLVKMNAGIATFRGRPAMIATFQNVTLERKREEALRESEEKYRTLVESSFDGIAIHQDGIVVYANRTAARLLGSDDPAVFIGKPAIELAAPAFRKLIAERVQRAPEKELELIREQFLKLDGTPIDVDVTTTPTTWQGRPAAYVTFRDITAQVRAEEALRESEEKYRMLVEQSRDGVFIIQDGRLVFYNKALTGLSGYTAEELDGRLLADLVAPEDREMVLSRAEDRAQGRQVSELYEFSLLHKDNNRRIRVRVSAGQGNYKGRPASIGMFYDVTEDRKREEALRESEEKFRALVETTSDFIWEVDAAGKYTYVSPQVRQILGYVPEEMIGRTPFDIMPPDEAERVEAEFRRCVASRLPIVTLENKAMRKDGSVVILETSGVVRTANDDSYQGYRGIDRDITRRKQDEEALRESEAQLSSILHGSPVLQFVIDRNHRVISWNKALEEYSGIRAEDMIGTDQQWRAFYPEKRPVLADLLIDKDMDTISRLYSGKFKKSRYFEGAFEATDFFPHMGSSGIWLSFTAAPIRDEQGAIIGAVETLEDVTERINAENALRESEEWIRTILNTAQAGIVLVDVVTHRIIDANKKALELICLDRDSVIGVVCHRFICPAEQGKCPVTDLGQQVDTSERVLINASGETIPVLKTVVPVLIHGRSVLVESFVDISEQKRSEAAIREANRKLNLLNSITRHDIRNQLMIAQGYTQLATLSKPDPVVSDFLVKITEAVQTIQRQIEFTKEYQELGVHAPAWFVIRNIVSTVRPEKIAVRNTCPAVEIFADPMIDKVFFNLFDNSMKYGERVTTVTVGCRQKGDDLVITFADNGVGILANEKQKIFEKGYGRNTGFGLFLVREILAITSISIRETGKQGEGAVFEITVPKGAFREIN